MANSPGDTLIFGGNFTTVNNTGSAWQLWNQNVAANAIHTSDAVSRQEMCLPGTRTIILDTLHDFLASTTDSNDVLWLHGSVGVGKSAVMRSLSRSEKIKPSLLATFFFFRSDETRNSTKPFVPTLAFQMIRNLRSTLPRLRAAAEAAIEDDPTIFSQPTERQAEALIIDALVSALQDAQPNSFASDTPFVILVDGLDECDGPENQIKVIETLIHILTEIHSKTNIRLKLVIASRPEAHLSDYFAQPEVNITSLSLNNDTESVNADIRLFFTYHFERIRRTHRRSRLLNLTAAWPSEEDLTTLVRRTDGQFAFADTVIRFTRDPAGNPVDRLKRILDGTISEGPFRPFDQLDQLYKTVFSFVSPELLPLTLRIVGPLASPTSTGAVLWSPGFLTCFFQISLDRVDEVFAPLASLFNVPDLTSPEGQTTLISPFHSSLGEFLHTESRSRQYGLYAGDEGDIVRIIAEAMIGALESDNQVEIFRVNFSHAFSWGFAAQYMDGRLSENPPAWFTDRLAVLNPLKTTSFSLLLLLFLSKIQRIPASQGTTPLKLLLVDALSERFHHSTITNVGCAATALLFFLSLNKSRSARTYYPPIYAYFIEGLASQDSDSTTLDGNGGWHNIHQAEDHFNSIDLLVEFNSIRDSSLLQSFFQPSDVLRAIQFLLGPEIKHLLPGYTETGTLKETTWTPSVTCLQYVAMWLDKGFLPPTAETLVSLTDLVYDRMGEGNVEETRRNAQELREELEADDYLYGDEFIAILKALLQFSETSLAQEEWSSDAVIQIESRIRSTLNSLEMAERRSVAGRARFTKRRGKGTGQDHTQLERQLETLALDLGIPYDGHRGRDAGDDFGLGDMMVGYGNFGRGDGMIGVGNSEVGDVMIINVDDEVQLTRREVGETEDSDDAGGGDDGLEYWTASSDDGTN